MAFSGSAINPLGLPIPNLVMILAACTVSLASPYFSLAQRVTLNVFSLALAFSCHDATRPLLRHCFLFKCARFF